MSDSEWLQKHKPGQSKALAHKPLPNPAPPPAETTPQPASTTSPPAAKASPAALVIGAVALMIGAYFYFDTQSRQADRLAAQQAAKRADAAPRVRTTAEIQANDAANRAYAKKLDDDAYRKHIITDILALNNIATRFNDVYQVAAASPRITLAGPVQQMQAIRRELQSMSTHPCLGPAHTALLGMVSESTNAFLSYMTNGNDETTKTEQHLANVKAYAIRYPEIRDQCVTW